MVSKAVVASALIVLLIFYLFFCSSSFGFTDAFELKVLLFILIILVITFGLYLAKILREPVMIVMR